MSDDRRMEAEQRYVSGSMTLGTLSQEMGLPLSNLKRWCKADNWVKKREKARKRALRKAVTRATDKKARELSRLLEASDAMERALLTSAKAFESAMLENPVEIVDGKTRAVNMSSVTHAIGRQLESRMLLEGMMSAADEARLDLLRRKQEMDERKEQQEAGGGGLTIRLEEAGEEVIIE